MAGPRKEAKSAARAMRAVGDKAITDAGTKMRGMTPGNAAGTSTSPARSRPQEAATSRPQYENTIRQKYASPAEKSRDAERARKIEMRRKGIRPDR